MINVLIIEDEAIAARNLTRMLAATDQEIQVLEVIESKKEAIKKIPTTNAELIFLDIHLSDGKSFDIFDEITCNIPIIFTTAYDKYVLQAFKHLSIDYLLKPFTQEDLQTALDKYITHFAEKKQDNNFQELINQINNPKSYKKRFLIQIGSKLKSVEITEVSHFYAQNKAVYLSTFDNRNYPIDFTLTQLENALNPDDYYRINRQYIIGRNALKDISYMSSTKLKIELNSKENKDIYVSTDKIVPFKNWLK